MSSINASGSVYAKYMFLILIQKIHTNWISAQLIINVFLWWNHIIISWATQHKLFKRSLIVAHLSVFHNITFISIWTKLATLPTLLCQFKFLECLHSTRTFLFSQKPNSFGMPIFSLNSWLFRPWIFFFFMEFGLKTKASGLFYLYLHFNTFLIANISLGCTFPFLKLLPTWIMLPFLHIILLGWFNFLTDII